ncbi:MAG: acyl-CoA synthetase FdrA [Rhodospirillales bacterium]|nr:acyl-CoA synthetase FdrA [Rhodospirillales bacterium]
MSATIINDVRRGFYLDSVALMRFSRVLATMDGIEEAAMMMASPSNRQIMADAGLLDQTSAGAEGGDLIIGIRATTPEAAEAARVQAEQLLDQPTSSTGDGARWRPKTMRAAVKAHPEANLALISVAGDFAAAEARKALRKGLHVMMFSDNVSIADELSLKREARDLGLLVMGPDCGTAILNGTPLAFANRVSAGDIGIIGASGTGTQEISCLISEGGGGISQAIGVGGRDLHEEIGAITTLMALDALDRDPATRHIVVISKPPAAAVAAQVVARIAASSKTFTVCFIGASGWQLPANATFAASLKGAAEHALGGNKLFAEFNADALAKPAKGRTVTGLFCGGTLCAEVQSLFLGAGEAVMSNAAISGVENLSTDPRRHKIIDLGSDEYTQGRPHPMIDPGVRDKALNGELDDADVGIVLLDVVIGFGAHEDPAGHLVDSLGGQTNGQTILIASVTGTDADPQNRKGQIAKLQAAGVLVAPSNADAAELALACLRLGG